MGRGIYKGAALQLVDDKGRVAIPASLRGTLIANSSDADMKDGLKATVAVHPQGLCLIAYDLPWGIALNDKATLRDAQHADANGEIDYNYKRRLSGAGEDVLLDSSGRFGLSGFQRKKAKLGRYAFFYGSLDHFEIWDPATLLAYADAPEVMRENLEYLLEDRKVVL